MSLPRRLLPGDEPALLFDSRASRAIERAGLARSPAHALIEAAGLAVARLAVAVAPRAERIWVAAGPGNNGGDGLVAARWLHHAGKRVRVTWFGDPKRLPADASHARAEALRAGLVLEPANAAPAHDDAAPDLAIDALLGLGQQRAPEGVLADTIRALNRCRERGSKVLAVDLPTGLCADTGHQLGEAIVRADATLALLTVKPGLLTADGRDAAGDIWWDDLGVRHDENVPPSARLAGRADARAAFAPRLGAAHASHKGRFGDAWIVGGAPGMVGAAQLAARASLDAGAGRVYLSLLDNDSGAATPAGGLELMQRPWADARAMGLAQHATVVCGCGGGDAVRLVLPELLGRAWRLVLDADALNAIAADPALAGQLEARGRRGAQTILTPHPLEATRLLGTSAAALQAERCAAAQRLAERFGATVVLKGSGSVIATAGATPVINPTGNARLATAGTGDVLAGWIGGAWSGHPATDEAAAACVAIGTTWLHGRAAEVTGSGGLPLPAARLIDAMAATAATLA